MTYLIRLQTRRTPHTKNFVYPCVQKCNLNVCWILHVTFRRHFRRKFWPHEKPEPLLLPIERWALTWYRYWSAGTVPLREKCTESSCDMSLARTFRRHFRQKFWPHEKPEPLLLPFERWALTWYRYWSAYSVPLRGKCTEKWCP